MAVCHGLTGVIMFKCISLTFVSSVRKSNQALNFLCRLKFLEFENAIEILFFFLIKQTFNSDWKTSEIDYSPNVQHQGMPTAPSSDFLLYSTASRFQPRNGQQYQESTSWAPCRQLFLGEGFRYQSYAALSQLPTEDSLSLCAAADIEGQILHTERSQSFTKA